MAIERDKQAKFHSVAEAVFTILIRGGIENLSHTRVASVSGVSRAWLYKYIGKNSDDLITYSLDAIGKEFAKIGVLLSQQSADDVRTSLFDGTFRMLESSEKNPALMALYSRYAGTATPVGQKIAELEKEYLEAVRSQLETFFKLPATEAAVVAEVLHAMRMGLAVRYSVHGLREKADYDGILRGIRRVFKHFAIEDHKNETAPV
jgi:DNA-binding transcriptional regulator YbjK